MLSSRSILNLILIVFFLCFLIFGNMYIQKHPEKLEEFQNNNPELFNKEVQERVKNLNNETNGETKNSYIE